MLIDKNLHSGFAQKGGEKRRGWKIGTCLARRYLFRMAKANDLLFQKRRFYRLVNG